MYEQNNILIVTILGLLCLGGVIYALWRLSKKHPNMKLGAIISAMGVDHNETIMIIIMFGVYMAEAVVASTVTIAGEASMSPLGRFLMHMSISVLGAVCGITFWRDVATIFNRKLEWRYKMPHMFVTLVVGYAALYVPILNTGLIASNLGQDMQYDLYLVSINPLVSHDYYQQLLADYGLPPNYYPRGNMLAIMKVSLVGLLVHYLIIAIEGGRNIASPHRQQMLFKNVLEELEEKKEDKKDEKKEDEKKEDTEGRKHLESNIRFLLSRCGYKGDELTKQVQNATKKIDAITSSTIKLGMVTRANNLRQVAIALDAKTGDTAKDKAENKKAIRDFFQKSPNSDNIEERGLGITLMGERKN